MTESQPPQKKKRIHKLLKVENPAPLLERILAVISYDVRAIGDKIKSGKCASEEDSKKLCNYGKLVHSLVKKPKTEETKEQVEEIEMTLEEIEAELAKKDAEEEERA